VDAAMMYQLAFARAVKQCLSCACTCRTPQGGAAHATRSLSLLLDHLKRSWRQMSAAGLIDMANLLYEAIECDTATLAHSKVEFLNLLAEILIVRCSDEVVWPLHQPLGQCAAVMINTIRVSKVLLTLEHGLLQKSTFCEKDSSMTTAPLLMPSLIHTLSVQNILVRPALAAGVIVWQLLSYCGSQDGCQ
jgi:hypothetical protein